MGANAGRGETSGTFYICIHSGGYRGQMAASNPLNEYLFLFYNLGTSCFIGFVLSQPIITGTPDGFSTFLLDYVQNSGNNLKKQLKIWQN